MIENAFTRQLGCTVPIQLAGMGGMNSPELVAAVSNAGALGMFGGANAPPEAIAQMCGSARNLTSAKFGVNFLVPFIDDEAVDSASQHADIVEFFYGEPDAALVQKVHQYDKLAFWQVGSIDEARAAEQAGCDFIVAQGIEGGGHIRGVMPLLPLIDGVLDVVRSPIIAAGGIGSSRAIAAVLAAGACAARVGTRFLAAAESNAHDDYVRRLIEAKAEDTELTQAYSVMWPDAPHRVLKSAVESASSHPGDAVAQMDLGHGVESVPKWLVVPPDKTARGNVEAMALYAGHSVNFVRTTQPAAEIVRELAEGTEQLLRLI